MKKFENRDCIEGMKEYQDNYFDLAIVDPPYGININMNMGRKKGCAPAHKNKSWDSSIPNEKYFNELSGSVEYPKISDQSPWKKGP